MLGATVVVLARAGGATLKSKKKKLEGANWLVARNALQVST